MKSVIVLGFIALCSFVTFSSAGCLDSASELTAMFAECYSSFPTILDDNLESELDSFCASSGDCTFNNFNTLLENMADECGVSIVYTNIDPIIEMIGTVCLQLDGEFCMVSMQAMLDAGITWPVTETELESYCDPCIPYYWSQLVSYASIDTQLTDLTAYSSVCMKEGDTWCALELQDLSIAFDDDDYLTAATISCTSACIPRYMSLNDYFDDDTWDQAFDILCYTNADGDLCWPLAYNALTTSNVMTLCPTTDLTQDCLDALTNLVDTAGCCFSALYNTVLEEEVYNRFETLFTEAGLTMPEVCDGSLTDIPQLELYLDNVDYEYAKDNWDDFAAWIMKDFNLNTGIDMDSIFAKLLNDTGSGIYILLQGLTASDLSTSLTLDSLLTLLTNQGFSLYETASSIDDDSRIDPVSGVTVGSSASAAGAVPADQYGASAALVVSVATLAFALCLSLL
ncbi:hypothetical protein Pelo_7518 [Pelomyxa schiedti]|nr:hypothetical protein Pelo_7518 [Pelomyxa schiedti]